MSPVLSRLEAQIGGPEADACAKTVRTLVRNAAENVEHQLMKVNTEYGRSDSRFN